MTTPSQANVKEAFLNNESLFKFAVQVAKEIDDSSYDISILVELLGFALTSTSVDDRVNGTKLLSAVLATLSKDTLNDQQLDFLVTFYADRLKDHHNVMPAIIDGIDSLVRMKNITRKNIPKLVHSFFQHTTCQSQVRSDRAKLFVIFKYLTGRYKEELMGMAGDWIYCLINSIDGERDPRNLDFIFTFMPDVLANYPLLHLSEEMFEIFACYFPIDFNPTKNDPDNITRDDLAIKLTNCLVANPTFVASTISLAIEKLESDLIVAKLDSLELLNQSASKFTPNDLEPHFEEIWIALKNEIFPGSDNIDVISSGLKTLSTFLERASSFPNISHNYQTTILGTVLTHLSDVNHHLFNPATKIALVCVAGDVTFSVDKVINSFLLNLKTKSEENSYTNIDTQIKIFNILTQVLQIVKLRSAFEQVNNDLALEIQTDVIAVLRQVEKSNFNADKVELQQSAINLLTVAVPLLNETNRALIYKVLVHLITHDYIDLDFKEITIHLGALYPVELQSNFINEILRNFSIFSSFVKRKIFQNLLPLVPQLAFAQRILDFVMDNSFKVEVTKDTRLLALEALNTLLVQQDKHFINELQVNTNLIHKIVELAQKNQLDMSSLELVSNALSRIVQHLAIAEQYAIVTEYLPSLNLQISSDLFIAKGLLAFLHRDIRLEDHFDRLLNDLTNLSLHSENEQMRHLAHHLLCSLVNKIDGDERCQKTLRSTILKLETSVNATDEKAVEALAWIAKGLIVCGSQEAADVVQNIADLLEHPSLYNAAILAFVTFTAEYNELDLPVKRFLYKQKFFHLIIDKLSQKLESYSENHLVAFIYVLKSTPHKVLCMNIDRIGPILLKTLDLIPKMHLQSLCIAISICESFIKEQNDYFRTHLNHIIASCLKLAKYKESMQVRISALNVMYDITKYPIFVLLPHKIDVVLELAATLDDPKRLVRNVAAKARNAWFLLDAPNTE